MKNDVPSELSGWEDIVGLANGDSVPVQNKVRVETSWKVVLAMVNLGNRIGSMQKVLGTRLDSLNERIDQFNKQSDKQSRNMFWLTIALVVATIMQAIATIVMVFKR